MGRQNRHEWYGIYIPSLLLTPTNVLLFLSVPQFGFPLKGEGYLFGSANKLV